MESGKHTSRRTNFQAKGFVTYATRSPSFYRPVKFIGRPSSTIYLFFTQGKKNSLLASGGYHAPMGDNTINCKKKDVGNI
jgi:hypothetical protein